VLATPGTAWISRHSWRDPAAVLSVIVAWAEPIGWASTGTSSRDWAAPGVVETKTVVMKIARITPTMDRNPDRGSSTNRRPASNRAGPACRANASPSVRVHHGPA
jgi:hypothetical protein